MRITAIAIAIGVAGGFVAQALMRLINLMTNLVFFHRWHTAVACVPPITSNGGSSATLIPTLDGR